MRRNFKCIFNPAQMMSERTTAGTDNPITYGININRVEMMLMIPRREQGDYSPDFLDWFLDFHAERLDFYEWERLPDWMRTLLKSRAETKHKWLRFNVQG